MNQGDFSQVPPFQGLPLSSGNDAPLGPLPRMSLPSVDPKNPPAWLCTCAKCGSNGKALPRRTWYTHNPGGKAAKYNLFADRGRPLSPARKARKRRCHEGVEEVEEVEEPPRISSRAGGSSSVCLSCIYAHRLRGIHENIHLGRSL